jgi:hypothetical protein
MTVALAVVRSGTGVTDTNANPLLRSTHLMYYQQDHLGSIAVVTDANGAVLERMATLAPREMRRAWMTGFGNARLDGRSTVDLVDLPDAQAGAVFVTQRTA